MSELWQARVFDSEAARGCSVAVVLPGAGAPTGLSAVAQDLDAEVTAFLLPGADGRTTLVSYRRGRKLDCSVAALLAAEAVLRERSDGAALFDTPIGVAEVVRDAGAWALPPLPELTSSRPLAPLANVLGRDPRGAFDAQVIDSGSRVYVRQVSDPATLQLLPLTPAQAWGYLRHEGLDAICLWARSPGSDEVSLRVFESSLAGREASASPDLLAALYVDLDRAEGPLIVQQGRGAPRRRATLRIRTLKGGLAVGGQVRLISRGQLLSGQASRERVA